MFVTSSQYYNNVSEQYKSLMGFSHYSNRDVVIKTENCPREENNTTHKIVRGVYNITII